MTRPFEGIGRGKRIARAVGVVLLGIVAMGLGSSTSQAKMSVTEKVGEKEASLQLYGFSQFEARGGSS